jgi:integrase
LNSERNRRLELANFLDCRGSAAIGRSAYGYGTDRLRSHGACGPAVAPHDVCADLAHLDLRGPHDLRHTFATWLEDAAIPSRVIDELMGHAGGRRDRGAGGSPMGRVYRETTPAMMARVTAALDDRIGHALAVAAYLLRERPDWRAVDGGEGL